MVRPSCPALAVVCVMVCGAIAAAETSPGFDAGIRDAAAFRKAMEVRIRQAGEAREKLVASRAIDGRRVLELADEIDFQLSVVDGECGLVDQTHPDAALRGVAREMRKKVEELQTATETDPRIYSVFSRLDLKGADAATRFLMEKRLRKLRLEGADRDAATRDRVRALRAQLTAARLEFDKNIAEGRRTLVLTSGRELEGLPEDYRKAHPAGADGRITISSDYPDSQPVLVYARDAEVRKRMYLTYMSRAYPENAEVLGRMLRLRHEIATTLGFANWADYSSAEMMAGSAKAISGFIDRVVEASKGAMEANYRELLERKRKDIPGATRLDAWDSNYYSDLVRRESYAYDSQSIRPYFRYSSVQQGVLASAAQLYGFRFERVPGAPVWHASVEAWDVFAGRERIGRMYLDMHPRPGKFSHAATFPIHTGVPGRQMAEAALVCNLPAETPGNPGLLSLADVTTFFHEFGHLMHFLLARGNRWTALNGFSTEWDFVEVPSQLLGEWARDPRTLASFARHYETGKAIPAELVEKMRRADRFGRGIRTRQQAYLSKLSLSYHDRDPKGLDPAALLRRIRDSYVPIPEAEGAHMEVAFTHLSGYDARYYTYLWSEVIEKDLYSEFDRKSLADGEIARRYREAILVPGGSKPAAAMVESFLGRKFRFDAWQRWLEGEED